jgi:sec-independent protein translocase protein TatA
VSIFREPWVLGIIILVAILLFAGPKLPGLARNLGQSMRIIKSEVKEMKNDGKEDKPAATPEAPVAATPEAPVEGKIVNNPTQPGSASGDGTGTGTGAQS